MAQWKDVPGYDNYMISDEGEVWSKISDRLLTPVMLNGFSVVHLHKNRRAKNFYIHRLMATTFFGAEVEGLKVIFVNGDRNDLRLDNIRVTELAVVKPEHLGRRVMILETGKIYNSVKECAREIYGSPSNIYGALNGRTFTYLGYHFRYVD